MGRIRLAFTAPVVVLCGIAAQGPQPALRIVSPAEGAYITGTVRLVATIDPPASVRDVTQVAFVADGHRVCTIVHPPFECDWHAGERIAEHQVRVVASLRDGSQLVQTVRTRGLIVTEAVDVDVVQVTAVVVDGAGRFVRGLTSRRGKHWRSAGCCRRFRGG